MRSPGRCYIADLCVGRKVKHVAVTACGKNDRVRGVGTDLAGDQVSDDDPFGVPIDQDQVEHFGPWIHLDRACSDFVFERLVSAQQQLLAGLTTGVKGSRDLDPSERTIRQQTAVLAREGNTLSYALVDDVET